MLTVSGTIPTGICGDITGGRRPRTDYLELAGSLDADLMDHAMARQSAGALGRLIGRIVGDDILLAWVCFTQRRRYRVMFTDGEQVGMPYAALTWLSRRRPAHVMIGHRLSARKKRRLHRALALQRRIDRVVVYSTAQQRCAIRELRYAADAVVLIPFMVDTDFWCSERVSPAPRGGPMICAAGQERRDYPTLIEAVRGLDIDVRIAAVSPWSKRPDSSAGLDLPDNVDARGYDLFSLRQLYADADVVVVPLEPTDFQAGITTILEAMSMAKAIVCTRTEGQTDTLVDGETGVYVPPKDARALREAILALIGDPDVRDALAARARGWVCDHASVATYVDRLVAIARDAAQSRVPR